MEKIKLTGFVFYESYLEALNELTAEQFKSMVNKIMDYMVNDIEPTFEDRDMRLIFKSIKTNLDSNKAKYLVKRIEDKKDKGGLIYG